MILVAVSGGLDSVALAYRLLTMQDEPVHIHHVHLHNRLAKRTGRAAQEDVAIERVIAWLETNCRPFTYSSSRVEQDRRTDIVIVTEHCAHLVKSGAIEWPSMFCRGAQAHDFARAAVGNRQAIAQGIWNRILGPDAPPIEYPLRNMTRAQYLVGVPEDLVALTWSCRRPVRINDRWAPCRECRTCQEYIAEGLDPAHRELETA